MTTASQIQQVALNMVDEAGVVTAVNSTTPFTVIPSQRTCVGRSTLSVTTAAVVQLGVGNTIPVGAVAAFIQADGAAVSITLDGTTPTANIGTRIDDGVIFPVDTILTTVKLIARTATTNVQVSYFNRA